MPFVHIDMYLREDSLYPTLSRLLLPFVLTLSQIWGHLEFGDVWGRVCGEAFHISSLSGPF